MKKVYIKVLLFLALFLTLKGYNAYSQSGSLILSPNPAYIGTIPVSSSETTTFSLLNVKSSSVNISGISVSGLNASDFIIPDNLVPATIGAYAEFKFEIEYKPANPGISQGILEIQTSVGTILDTLTANATSIVNGHATFERILGIESNIDKSKQLQFTQTKNGNFVITASTILRSDDFSYITFDVYLLKTDPLGKLLWYRVFEFGTNGGKETVDGGADEGIDVLSLADESILVVATTNAGGPGSKSVYLSKWSGDGEFLWENTYGGKWDDQPYHIIQDSEGKLLIVGSTNNTADNSKNIMVMKIGTDGTLIWNKNYGTPGIENGIDIVETDDGNYMIIGNSQNPVANMSFLKIDKSGNEIWNKILANSKMCEAGAFVKTSDGGYAVAGYILTDDMAMQGYLVKVNASAELQWSKSFGGTNIDFFRSLVETKDGGILCVGSSNRFFSFEYVYDDIWLVKTDNSGNMIWERKYGGNKTQYASDVMATMDGGYALTGETESYREKPRIYLMEVNAEGKTVGIKNLVNNPPSGLSLSQNLPNPFSLNTSIEFNVPAGIKGKVELKVYDMLGKEVATLVDKEIPGGNYQVNFNSGNLLPGIYFYCLKNGMNSITKKMILVN